jgi:uncharacterized ferredoxin-like protein
MTAAPGTTQDRLSIEDVRRKAERVEEIAREEVDHILHRDATKYAMYGVVAIVTVIGVAYFMGARSANRRRSRAALPQPE